MSAAFPEALIWMKVGGWLLRRNRLSWCRFVLVELSFQNASKEENVRRFLLAETFIPSLKSSYS